MLFLMPNHVKALKALVHEFKKMKKKQTNDRVMTLGQKAWNVRRPCLLLVLPAGPGKSLAARAPTEKLVLKTEQMEKQDK